MNAPGLPPWSISTVRGRSMLPTLRDGDRLLVRRVRRARAAAPAGARAPAATGTARPGRLAVVRLPGGRPLAVKRLGHHEDGGWWVERDNPAEGVDSWQLGAIPDADVLGLVLARIWPRPRPL